MCNARFWYPPKLGLFPVAVAAGAWCSCFSAGPKLRNVRHPDVCSRYVGHVIRGTYLLTVERDMDRMGVGSWELGVGSWELGVPSAECRVPSAECRVT